MKVFGQSDIGTVRAENQDCFAVHELGGGILAAVCDGMGGAAAGSLASSITCQTFCGFAVAAIKAGKGRKIAQSLTSAADAANRAVYTRAMEDVACDGMGSTLVALYAGNDGIVLLNVGDSCAYRISDGTLQKLTHDHSLVQELVDSGKISADQAKNHPQKNIITRVIGGDIFVRSDIFESDAESGDLFLLCSDGLINAITENELLAICQNGGEPEAICHALIDAALVGGARDNVTAVILAYEKGAGNHE